MYKKLDREVAAWLARYTLLCACALVDRWRGVLRGLLYWPFVIPYLAARHVLDLKGDLALIGMEWIIQNFVLLEISKLDRYGVESCLKGICINSIHLILLVIQSEIRCHRTSLC